jgi:hypothetical protein
MRKMNRADGHPSEETLRSYLDGELGWIAARRCARHLRRCGSCGDLLAEQQRLGQLVADRLVRLHVPVDTGEAWNRFRALSGAHPLAASRPRLGHAAAIAGAALALGAAAFLLVRHGLPAWAPGRDVARVLDLCCWDLDGGGPGDDGVLTVTLGGERVVALTLYEDRNGSRSLTTRDPIRYAARTSVQPLAADARERPQVPPVDAALVRDFCCADYDGGGSTDDGVFTVNRPGERVDAVVLYEDVDVSRSFSPADRVRWSTGPGAGASARLERDEP